MSHRKRAAHRATLDRAEELARNVKPAPGPQPGGGRMWNPTTNPVQVHAPKPDPKPREQ
jgi:hypothetical protein